MHGLIFVTWEKYLTERFGSGFLSAYRGAIGEAIANAPLASRLYDDATLLTGVGAASKISGLSADTLLREYGRYFIINGLTSHLCTYVLSQVHSGRDLLLTMRDVHARLRRTEEGLTPPLFNYELSPHPNEVVLLYDSPRKVCDVLWGAIEGAAERYGEHVHIVEETCMKQGASFCRFIARFSPPQASKQRHLQVREQVTRQQTQKEFAEIVLDFLPEGGRGPTGSVTLADLQKILRLHRQMSAHYLRPAVLLEALQHLQFAGYVASTANQPGDDLTRRRYWRVRVFWE
jgi:Haem-NO-binding